MKKTKLASFAVLMVSLALFLAVVIAGPNQAAGYQSFKNVLRANNSTRGYDNATIYATVEVSDNDQRILLLEADLSADNLNELVSGTVKLSNLTQSTEIDIYSAGEKLYIVDENNNGYYLDNPKDHEPKQYREHNDQNWSIAGEKFLDYFVGDLRQQFEEAVNEDGSKVITVELNENEMPELVKLIASINSQNNKWHSDDDDTVNWASDLPFLGIIQSTCKSLPEIMIDKEVRLLKFDLKVDKNNTVNGMGFEINLTGVDGNGQFHDLVLKIQADCSMINMTEVNPIDLEKYHWEEVKTPDIDQ